MDNQRVDRLEDRRMPQTLLEWVKGAERAPTAASPRQEEVYRWNAPDQSQNRDAGITHPGGRKSRHFPMQGAGRPQQGQGQGCAAAFSQP